MPTSLWEKPLGTLIFWSCEWTNSPDMIIAYRLACDPESPRQPSLFKYQTGELLQTTGPQLIISDLRFSYFPVV